MHDYSGEQKQLIEEDVDRIRTQWHILQHELANGTGPAHLPPAVSLTSLSICEALLDLSVDDPEELDKVAVLSGANLVSFGAMLFALGQKTANAGIIMSNMSQCDCMDITDEDIKELLNGKN